MKIKKIEKPKKSGRKKLIKELDSVCCAAVLKRDKYTCVKCHRKYPKGNRAISWSHFWSRRYKSTRWMLCNVYCMCWGCHQQVEKEKQGWYSDFMVEKLGLEGYEWLENEAMKTARWKDWELEEMIEDYRSQL